MAARTCSVDVESSGVRFEGRTAMLGYDQMLFIRVIDHFVTVYKRMFWVVGTNSIFVGSVDGKKHFQNEIAILLKMYVKLELPINFWLNT